MTPEGTAPEAPTGPAQELIPEAPTGPAQELTPVGLPEVRTLNPEPTAPTTGKRPALGNLRRELLDTELAHPGVHKLLLDRIDSAESECCDLRAYVGKFHEADKDAAVLRAQLRTGTAFEILCAGGFGCGGILIGVAPSLHSTNATTSMIVFFIGVTFILISTIARVVQVKK